MKQNLPEIFSAVSRATGAPTEMVKGVIECFLVELHHRAHGEPRPARDYINSELKNEITPTAYFYLTGVLNYLASHDWDNWADIQRDSVPFSDFLIGANTVRRWEGRPPELHSSSTAFLGLPDNTIEIELDVFCRGENESAYVDEVSERASGYTIEPLDAWDLDLWDDTEIDGIVRGCARSLAKSDGLKSRSRDAGNENRVEQTRAQRFACQLTHRAEPNAISWMAGPSSATTIPEE